MGGGGFEERQNAQISNNNTLHNYTTQATYQTKKSGFFGPHGSEFAR